MVVLDAPREELARDDVGVVGDVRIHHRAVVVIRRPRRCFGRVGPRLQPDRSHLRGRSLRGGGRCRRHEAAGGQENRTRQDDGQHVGSAPGQRSAKARSLHAPRSVPHTTWILRDPRRRGQG